MDCQERPLGDTIAFTRLLKMHDHRLVAHPQNARDLPIRFSTRRPHYAFALPIRQPRLRRALANAANASRRLESKCADELRQRQELAT